MATVAFQRGEFGQLFRQASRGNNSLAPQIQEVFQQLQRTRTAQDVDDALEAVNDLAEGHGIESIQPANAFVNNFYRNIVALYVNFGDTYDLTLLYDTEANTFYLTSWGDWLQGWEQANPPEPEEEVCAQCGGITPVEELHHGLCRECDREPPTWHPGPDEPLIAVLRSVEGYPVAVHVIDKENLVLAFSVLQSGDIYYAQREDEPYTRTWPSVVDAFSNKQHTDLYVAGIGEQRGGMPDVSIGIEREMFERLRVAMDAAMEAGLERQPVKVFLETPPVLWTCDQINYVVWDRGERDWPGAVEAFIATFDAFGTVQTDISVWSASGSAMTELIEDGFIKFGDDESVRRYLLEQGLCRRN